MLLFQITYIKRLSVRGAPMIGIAAGMSLVKFWESGASREAVLATAERLRASRPTAVNLMVCLDRLIRHETAEAMSKEMELLQDEDESMCLAMARNGAALVQEGEHILTHCNTGSLATVGVGTALGVIRVAHEQGKGIHVYVDETRPLLQGGRLTTYELTKEAIPFTLITDSMAGSLLRDGKVQRVFVGADRIALNGDFANKIGTYSLAALCHLHNVPFYCVAPSTTIDKDLADGSTIPIEQRNGDEVRGVVFPNKTVSWAPDGCHVYNPAFDVTPAKFVTAWVLEDCVHSHEDVAAGSLKELAATTSS